MLCGVRERFFLPRRNTFRQGRNGKEHPRAIIYIGLSFGDTSYSLGRWMESHSSACELQLGTSHRGWPFWHFEVDGYFSAKPGFFPAPHNPFPDTQRSVSSPVFLEVLPPHTPSSQRSGRPVLTSHPAI